MTRTLLQQALDALHRVESVQNSSVKDFEFAVDALRSAIAAPQPEPVAWRWRERPHESRSWGDWHYMVNKPQGPASATFQMEPIYATPPAAPAPAVPLQGGMDNNELLAAWQKKLPGRVPEGQELNAFAVGTEVGFEHAQRLERMDWDRVHHVLAKHGKHPGRTDDHLADVIDKALSAAPAVPPADEQIIEAASNWDCGTRHENEEWAFKRPRELLQFARAVLALSAAHAAPAVRDAEIAQLKAQLDAVLKWQQEGEALFNRGQNVPVWFRLVG